MSQFLRDQASDSDEVVTPLMLDGTYLSRNFATLGPTLCQPPWPLRTKNPTTASQGRTRTKKRRLVPDFIISFSFSFLILVRHQQWLTEISFIKKSFLQLGCCGLTLNSFSKTGSHIPFHYWFSLSSCFIFFFFASIKPLTSEN